MEKRKSLFKKVLLALLTMLIIAGTIIGVWYFTQTPSNERDWSLDQAVLPYAEFRENEVEVFNVRNFTYNSTSEYEANYYNRVFNLDELSSVDYIVVPFDNIGAAHTFVSFGFKNGRYLAVSVEIRKEKGESFSALKGLLRHYEIMYVVADEKDVISLRAKHRQDDVYIYPVKTTNENMKRLFTDMLTRANKLKAEPEFYNTLTSTCTTNIARHINNISPNRIPKDLRLLLPKNSDALAYELGLIDNSLPLEELRAKYKIDDKAEQYSKLANFSEMIRR
jgi:hypothetical protein